jgi:RHS repeat-associated protein
MNDLSLWRRYDYGSQGPQVTLSYDADQRMTSMLRATASTGPTITTNYAYDNADRVTTITHSSSSAGALATYLYSYDAGSQLLQYTGPEGTLTYMYDPSGELTNIGDTGLETYSYDLNGNRNYGSYTTASDNRLTADGTYTMAYDAEGNMTSKTRVSDGETWTITWDNRNRLTQVVEKTSAGVTVTNDVFTYDVENRRIGKSVNGTQSWFGYDGQNSYADFNGSGSLTMRYLIGQALDSLYARFDGTNAGWYLDDMLGSARQIANTSGTVLDALTYDSYGQILSDSNSSNGDRFKYTSREWDSEIGLCFYRARSYCPLDGRFISQDPVGFRAGDDNLMRYVKNSPAIGIDPLGTTQPYREDWQPPGDPWYSGILWFNGERISIRDRGCYGNAVLMMNVPYRYQKNPFSDPFMYAFKNMRDAMAAHHRLGGILFAFQYNGDYDLKSAGVLPGDVIPPSMQQLGKDKNTYNYVVLMENPPYGGTWVTQHPETSGGGTITWRYSSAPPMFGINTGTLYAHVLWCLRLWDHAVMYKAYG